MFFLGTLVALLLHFMRRIVLEITRKRVREVEEGFVMMTWEV